MHRFRLIVTFLLFALNGPALAGTATDLVFAENVLANIPTDKTVVYRHVRDGPDDPAFISLEDGTVTLTLTTGADGRSEALMTFKANGRTRNISPFPADAGNPIVMAFLESSLRSMAQITGGSPYYIRNRIKEALRSSGDVTPITIEIDGKTIDAREVVFHPFENDKNADRMGDFAGLELKFVVADDVPGGFVLFSAQTPENSGKRVYAEIMQYDSLNGN